MSIICPTRPEGSEPSRSSLKARGGVGGGQSPGQLDAVSYHLQSALQVIRDLPAASLAREEFLTWIYHLTSAALTLVVNDSKSRGDDNRRVITKGASPEPGPEAPGLAGDLDLIR